MLVWDYDNGREIDDTRNNYGDERMTLTEALAVAHFANDERSVMEGLRRDLAEMTRQRNLANDHSATIERVAFEVIENIASAGRRYAIDNTLCENYERFLSFGVGEVRDRWLASETEATDEYYEATDRNEGIIARAHMLSQRFGRNLTERYVRFATRPREFVVTAPVTVTTRVLRSTAPDVYDFGYWINAAADRDRLSFNGHDTETSQIEMTEDDEPLTYERAVAANENFHRRGSYENSDY